jgi:hypothetical protein
MMRNNPGESCREDTLTRFSADGRDAKTRVEMTVHQVKEKIIGAKVFIWWTTGGS